MTFYKVELSYTVKVDGLYSYSDGYGGMWLAFDSPLADATAAGYCGA